MCILLKLHYAKFDVSRLFCSKVIEEKPLGIGSTLPPVKEGLKQMSSSSFHMFIYARSEQCDVGPIYTITNIRSVSESIQVN